MQRFHLRPLDHDNKPAQQPQFQKALAKILFCKTPLDECKLQGFWQAVLKLIEAICFKNTLMTD